MTRFLEFCRYLRSLYAPTVRIAIVCDNYSPHLSIAKASRVGDWIEPNNVEIAYTRVSCSWLNRLIEAHFTALVIEEVEDDHEARIEAVDGVD